jgi:hypothetical protein
MRRAALVLGLWVASCGTPSQPPAEAMAHAQCFQIDKGVHMNVTCAQCHQPAVPTQFAGTCNTGTAVCVTCHDHACATSDAQHLNQPGYQCKDRKCYECHLFKL